MQKPNIIIIVSVFLLVLATIASDYLFSRFQNGAFFISESLLFSTFWIIFLPLLNIQYRIIKLTGRLLPGMLTAVVLATVHLFFYPVLVWLLSKLFFDHTFSYWQTFHFGLTEHLIKAVLVYILAIPIFVGLGSPSQKVSALEEISGHSPRPFAITLLVTDNNKKTVIETRDILYISANAPYVSIHLKARKYLLTDTLKSLVLKLDERQFVRIHKSHIVNITHVASYQSRLNGDYDLTLSDNSVIRVSRKYASAFKARYEAGHRVTPK